MQEMDYYRKRKRRSYEVFNKKIIQEGFWDSK